MRKPSCGHSADDTRQHCGGGSRASPGDDVEHSCDALVDVLAAAFDQTVGDDDERGALLQLDVDHRPVVRLHAEGQPTVACDETGPVVVNTYRLQVACVRDPHCAVSGVDEQVENRHEL